MKKLIVLTALALASLQAWPANKKDSILVTDVYRLNHYRHDDSARNSAGIGDIIVIKVNGLATLFKSAYPATGPKREIRLFLGDRQIGDLVHLSSPPQQENGEIQFKLERTVNNDKDWSDLFGRPGFSQFFLRRTQISVGLDGGSPANSQATHFRLIRIREYWFYGCLAGLVLYFYFLRKYAVNTCMLRETVVDLSPLNLASMKPQIPPYSLAKVQMAFWFSIILASYFFIWLITGNYEIITAGSLGLIGIGAGTALGAVSIDNNKAQDAIKQVQALQQQEAGLWSDVHTLEAIVPQGPTTPTDILFKKNAIEQVQAAIKQQLQSLTLPSASFLNDLLNDINGISFHRLQMFVWMIVLGLIFVYTVWANLTMPDFSPTLLTMQGITAGTYLGFKLPEKQV